MIAIVILDYTVAFNIIDHDILLKNLNAMVLLQMHYYGWRVIYCKGSSFLNGTMSDKLNINCGVPQGSCFGLLLYTIF